MAHKRVGMRDRSWKEEVARGGTSRVVGWGCAGRLLSRLGTVCDPLALSSMLTKLNYRWI